jgi:hypothetical protein
MLSGKCDPLFVAFQATKRPQIAPDELRRAITYSGRL